VPRPKAAAGAAGALGNTADFVSPADGFLPPPSTVKAWYLRSYARQTLWKAGIDRRMRYCGARIGRKFDGVGVYARPDRAYGRVNGVCVCGQSLACPVCAPRIAAFRAAEVSTAFERAGKLGYEARLVTFTVPHSSGTTLGTEIDCFAAAWRAFQTGKRGVERRAYSLGNHVGREVTYGEKNGWHYHHHQLRYDEAGRFDHERTEAQWLAALETVGRKWRGAELHAFDCGAVGSQAGARYVAKLATSVEAQGRAIGSEIASGATKGKNLATLLSQAVAGDAISERAWLSGVADVLNRKVSSVRWSRGLRAKVGMEAEKSDGQVALEEVVSTDIFLGALTPMQWRGVLLHRAEFALCVAANQGEQAVNNFLAGLGLGQLNDDARPAVVVPLEAETCYTGFNPVME
jgi:hypothetical protein